MSTLQQAPLTENLSEDLHHAVEKTFSQMFATAVKSEFKVIPREETPSCDVTSIITLTQVEPQGALVMTFPQATLFALLKKFYKKDFTEIDKKVMDAVGEISNIIFGVFKHRARNKNYQFRLAMPQLFAGGGARVPSVVWTLKGDFTTDVGVFHVMLMQVQSKV